MHRLCQRGVLLLSGPVGIGAKGNEGVANNVSQTKGSIVYVEYAYALQNKLVYTRMVNKDGKTVSPTSEAFQAAAANADWNSVPGYGVILANQPGAASWPMTAATFILIPKQPPDAAAATTALKFFAWAYANGGKMAEELDYVPMPAEVVKQDQGDVGQIHHRERRQAALHHKLTLHGTAQGAPLETKWVCSAGAGSGRCKRRGWRNCLGF